MAYRDVPVAIEMCPGCNGEVLAGSLDGAPEGDHPVVGDIGYWAPDGNLVFYCGDVGLWNGIVRIGEFDGEMDAIERQSEDFTVTIERG